MKTYSFLENLSQYDIEEETHNLNLQHSLEYVDWDKLVITIEQKNRFDPDHALEIMSGYHPGVHRPICVAHYNDEYIVWDGHHSAVAAYKTGMKQAPCVVFRCERLSDFQDLLDADTFIKFDNSQLEIMFAELIAGKEVS